MIKYVILFIHLIGLSIYQLFFGDVTASQKIPNKIKAGEEVIVEILISKDDVTGFAKFQETIPAGFLVEVVDAKGATFSFKENIVKFIWMALPADKEFSISYKLKPGENISGEFDFGGKFSFISDNERKNIDVPNTSVTITKELDEQVAENVPNPNVVETVETEVEPTVTEPVAEIVTETTVPKVSINTARTIENIGNKYKVSLTINQTNLEGFAKFVDVIPAGFTASTDNPEGGIFSFNDNEAKILWMAAPKKEQYTVSYILEPNSDLSDGSFDINGTISYLENDVTSKYIIDPANFKHESQSIAQVEPEKIVEIPKDQETTTEKPVVKPTEEKPVTSTPTAEKGVTYKVQVGAGHQNVSKNYFASKFNVSDAIAIESHEGWIKYVIGKFNEYKEARDKRNDVRNNIKTAFVTAYNQGRRITVQEALMISNQKWYQ
ncbi:MAG: hypothetical protein HYU68_10195 [Bacteroidetes bacterium]|nr:hypothetical protein [Bacteroidota bacterium]